MCRWHSGTLFPAAQRLAAVATATRSKFNDTGGLTSTATATSIDGASTVVFGLGDGVPVVAPQRPVRAQGGFVQFGVPLSRVFDADPKGRNAGWTAYLYYGYDQAT